MAKKSTKKTAAKKSVKKRTGQKVVPLAIQPGRVLRSYRIVRSDGREPEVVRCHAVNVYGSCCEFVKMEGVEEEWVTLLVLPASDFQRVEFVDPTPADVEMAPGTDSPLYGDGITDVTETTPAAEQV